MSPRIVISIDRTDWMVVVTVSGGRRVKAAFEIKILPPNGDSFAVVVQDIIDILDQ